MQALFCLGLDNFAAEGAFLGIVVFEQGGDDHVDFLLQRGVSERVVAESIYTTEIVQWQQQAQGPLALLLVGGLVEDEGHYWGDVFSLHAIVESLHRLNLRLIAGVLLAQCFAVDNCPLEGHLVADHHQVAFFAAWQLHIPVGGGVAVLALDLFPALYQEGAIVIEADKQHVGTPTQAVADMKLGGLAAIHLGVAVRTGMHFIKKAVIAYKHRDSLHIK